jgi:hypothetical protein
MPGFSMPPAFGIATSTANVRLCSLTDAPTKRLVPANSVLPMFSNVTVATVPLRISPAYRSGTPPVTFSVSMSMMRPTGVPGPTMEPTSTVRASSTPAMGARTTARSRRAASMRTVASAVSAA